MRAHSNDHSSPFISNSCYESFAIVGLYLFFCQIIVSGDGKAHEVTFTNVRRAIMAANARDSTPEKNLGWLKGSLKSAALCIMSY